MRATKTFSIRTTTIKRLKTEVSSGHRSSFVDDSIINRLDQAQDFCIIDIPARNRAASLLECDEIPDHIKVLIRNWLMEGKE
jgi:hypothetical protein